MAHQFEDARCEIRSPYPGLRPFQDFESAMFYGRYSQTCEVLERLGQSHFVALLGGSGSGKSSLIRAGVIPDLRSYQLREAGDFWVPVVFTPGTDFAEARSPLDRLAWAFCRVLKPPDNKTEEEERRNKCVEIMREANGLAVLVDTFTSDLNIPPGPDMALANFLFVVDQFEELFHPTNKGLLDCAVLVERLLDHFGEPHRRVFVVLTMRSEHLNDCTGYLYLPDAINKASYLIRRLDLNEIEEAIEMPAKRFLRLLARSSERRGTLPRTIEFDEAVKKRLKDDVDTLAVDPDHLPLLQHALFRLWEVACARANAESPDAQGVVLPERITEEDLDAAIRAGRLAGQGEEGTRNHTVLRPCLQNWANKLFHSYDEKKDEKKLVEQLFRRLAFRDPNTSNYTQQRVELRQIAKLLGVPVDMLDSLVVRYMEPHEYLLRDMDGKAVKVAHESFIRGWTEFQCWVDQEYERFREYLNMLGECQRWERDNRSEKRLLGEERLRRIREVGLEHAFNNPEMMDRLSRLVDMRRDAERWRMGPDDIKKFYEASVTKQEQELLRKQAEARRRRKVRRWGTAFVMLAVLLGTAGLAVYLSMQQESGHLHSFAIASVTYKRFEAEFPSADEAKVPLHQALVSAKYFQPGDTPSLTMKINTLFNETLAKLPVFSERADRLARIGGLAESTIVETLGKVLSNAAWKSEPPKANKSEPTEEAIQSCKSNDGREEKGGKLVMQNSEDSTNGEKRALYIQSGGETMPLQVYAAKVTRNGCQIGDLVNSFPPPKEGTPLGVERSLRYFFASLSRSHEHGTLSTSLCNRLV